MIPIAHLQVLKKIVDRLRDCTQPWVVTGSLGMAIRGMPLNVHDIDLQTTKDGTYEIERILKDFVVAPVYIRESERIRSYFATLVIDRIDVEIMGDMQFRQEDQNWLEPVKIEIERQWVEIAELFVPVLSLEHELQAYQMMGRKEKAAMIQAWLESKR